VRAHRPGLIRALLLALPAAALWPHPEAAAVNPDRPMKQYSLSSWETRDGLPHNTVQGLAQTADGYLWVATVEGLSRFDGFRFKIFDRANTEALTRNDIQSLYAARDGSLWISAYGSGLIRYRDGSFRAYAPPGGWAQTTVSAIAEDARGALWIGTDGGGLFRLKDDVFERLSVEQGLSHNSVWSLYPRRDGGMWVGTSAGVDRLIDGRFEPYPGREGLSGRVVTALVEDAAGRLLAGTADGLYSLEGGLFRKAEGLSQDYVRALLEDSAGTLWVGTDQGLSRVRGTRVEVLGVADGLPSRVTSVLEDREGGLWLGTWSSGLFRLTDGAVTRFLPGTGVSGDEIVSIAGARGGGAWLGTNGGEIDRYDGARFTSLHATGDLRRASVLALHEDRGGRLWAGTDLGLHRFEKGRWTHYTRREGLPNSIVRSVLEDSRGRLWVGTDGGGLALFEQGKFRIFSKPDGLPSDHLRALHEDAKGTLWIATYGGLASLTDGRFRSYTTRDGLSSDLVRSFHEDAEGALWIGTYGGGLNRLKDGHITAYTSRDGLFNDVIYGILEDDGGRLWMSCNKGLFSVEKRQLEDFAAGRRKDVVSLAYGRADGMISSDFSGGFPAAWKAPNGRLWFPSTRGVVAIDPKAAARPRPAPAAIVEERFVDGEPVPPGVSVDVGPQARRLEFHFTALAFATPERLEFAYRLQDFDPGWVPAGPLRVAQYTNIPPGRYQFRVRVRNRDGDWNEDGAPIGLRVRPHWYRTTAFYALAVVGVVLAVLGAYRVRVGQLVARERELGRRVKEALAEVKTLSGLLPICSSCKNVREDGGYWQRIESYIQTHSQAQFTHGICPDCMVKLYPEETKRIAARTKPS
jgi:ligand-binding sensor domain-containing protein